MAGVLRSFDYAAAMAGRATTDLADSAHARAADLLERFRRQAAAAFLGGYGQAETPLLDLFLLEKAAYEVSYEVANRPTWVDVPLRGLAVLAQRLTTVDEAKS